MYIVKKFRVCYYDVKSSWLVATTYEGWKDEKCYSEDYVEALKKEHTKVWVEWREEIHKPNTSITTFDLFHPNRF